MVQHEALFRLSTDHAEQILRAVTPELADEVNLRSTTRCWLEEPSTLVIKIEAQDTAALRAALNMILRLANVADEVQGLIKVNRRISEESPGLSSHVPSSHSED